MRRAPGSRPWRAATGEADAGNELVQAHRPGALAAARRSARAGRSGGPSCAGSPCRRADRTHARRPLEPLERLVEPLPDQALQALVAVRALARGSRRARGAARRRSSRAASNRPARLPFSWTTTLVPELAGARGRDEPRHPRAGDGQRQFSANVGLCSTYSILTRSGPQRNTAYVFGPSTTSATSRRQLLRVVRVVDEDGEVVEQRPFALLDVALVELDEGSAELDPRRPVRAAPPRRSRARGRRAPPTPGRSRRARRGRGRSRPRRRLGRPRPSAPPRPRAAAPLRRATRSVTCLSAPCSRGPSASKSVSLKRRASAPSSVNRSVRSITW